RGARRDRALPARRRPAAGAHRVRRGRQRRAAVADRDAEPAGRAALRRRRRARAAAGPARPRAAAARRPLRRRRAAVGTAPARGVPGARPVGLPDRPAGHRQRRPARARRSGPGAGRAGRRRAADRDRQRPRDGGAHRSGRRKRAAGHGRARRAARRDGPGRPDPRRRLRAARGAAARGARVIGVLVVDDQSMVREGFAALLAAQEDIEVLGTAGDGQEAVELARKVAPDVVLMDVRMPRLDGIEATRILLAEEPTPKVLVLTTFDLDDHIYAALRAGASGFLLKHAPAAELLHAVRVFAAGDALLAPEITQRLIAHYLATGPATGADGNRTPALAALTPREPEVLRLVARGLSNREIADALVVVEQTAKT